MSMPTVFGSPSHLPCIGSRRGRLTVLTMTSISLALTFVYPGLVAVQAADLRSGHGGSEYSGTVSTPAGTPCDATTPGIIIHDDDTAENGYSFDMGVVSEGRYVDKFTPSSYPATFSSVCFSFTTPSPATSMNFTIIVYAADGDGGGPGTLLASKAVTGEVFAQVGLPFTPSFQTFDISDLALNIASGDVYIGARWNPMVEGFVYLAADESGLPAAGGRVWQDWPIDPPTDGWRVLGVDPYYPVHYRALMVRATEGPAGPPAVTLSERFSPATILDSRTSTLTVTLTNQTATPATLTDPLINILPDGLLVATTADPTAATTCLNGTVMAFEDSSLIRWLTPGSAIPANGSCTVTVETKASAGQYESVFDAGALATDAGTNAYPATATLMVTANAGTFPEPYCPITFSGAVQPITYVHGAGLDNRSDATLDGSPQLEDFTNIVGRVSPGEFISSFVIEGNTAGTPPGPGVNFLKIYADWNHNGLFTDAGEGYTGQPLAPSTGTDGVQAVFQIQVPANALLGSTRLRIVKSPNFPIPCDSIAFPPLVDGQAEDYTIDVIAPMCGAADEVFCDGFDALDRFQHRTPLH
jgi:GEVED domain-containing protein